MSEFDHSTTRSEVMPFDPRSRRETWTPALFGMTKPPVFEATRVGNQKGEATVVWLYRFYGEHGTTPLYIGITVNPAGRWPDHMQQPWWPLVRFASIEAIPPKERHALETAAIRGEQPLHNVTQKARPIYTGLYLDQSPEAIVKHLRDRMWPEDFAALVAAFKSESQSTEAQ